jgi:hypothetical protein
MRENDTLNFAGDVRIDNCTLTSIASGNSLNIINQVITIQVYEDLFSPFISGNIIVKESLDILNELPITGQEWLDLSIRTPSLEDSVDIKGRFFVYKISDRDYVAERNVVYKLHFISEHALKDASTIISKGYKGKVSDIAKQILTDWVTEKNIGDVETTKNSNRYVSNFWTPTKNLNFLCNNAINMYDSPSYITFQNRDGYNFKSLHKMYNEDSIRTFNYNMKGREVLDTGQAARLIENDYSRINTIELPDSFDNVYKMTQGAFASTLHSYDIVSKEYKVDLYQYRDKFNTDNFDKKHLNNYPLTTTKMEEYFNPKSHIMTDFRQYGIFNQYGDVSNYRIMQERISNLIQAEGISIRILVPGRTDYTVGQKVEVEIMKPEPMKDTDNEQDQRDNTFSGYYLIAAINHSINRERHECSIELIKDSWLKNVDNFSESSE